MDLDISLLQNSNTPRNSATSWLFHKGQFNITIIQKLGDPVTNLQTYLQDGLGS